MPLDALDLIFELAHEKVPTWHLNTLSKRRLSHVLKILWGYLLNCTLESMFKSICKKMSPFNRHWSNHVAINCMQDLLLISSFVYL